MYVTTPTSISIRLAALAAVTGVLTTAAHAQWTVTNMLPTEATWTSQAASISNGQQAGWITVGSFEQAGIWSGTAQSWVNLHPASAGWSQAYGIGGGKQVGRARVGGVVHASLWSGTAASWVDLHPAGAWRSDAYATTGTQHVGFVEVSLGTTNAALWGGSSSSWGNLNPAGATSSGAYGIGGGQQVGWAVVSGSPRASLWSGSAASWINLHPAPPAGATDSFARATNGSQQAGWATINGLPHASLWSGTAASWVDLSPAGDEGSVIYAIGEGQQVGYATVGGTVRASLWSGSAGSWVDLHAQLPAGFSESAAWGISSDGVNTYVAGYAYNQNTGHNDPILWTRPIPRNEILWRNAANGLNLAWNVAADGQSVASSSALPTVSDINWKLVANADFNADGTRDLVWRNSVTGHNAVWFMNGAAIASAADLPRVNDLNWEIRAVADFNSDNVPDLLWRNSGTGANVVWIMGSTFGAVTSVTAISSVSDPYWQIAGAGDFNADAKPDIVWRNARTGAHAVWYMNGTSFAGAADISPAASDVNVRIAAVADYNADSKPDLLMRNTLTGANELWIMNGVTRASVVTLPSVVDTYWRTMAQTPFKAGQDSDFNGDGKADLLLRHGTNGQNAVWLLNGTSFASLVNLTPITDNNWVVEAVADLNRDNKTDIFWRNRVNGLNVLWIMNGTTVTQSVNMPSVTNLAWHVGAVADVDGDEIADLIWNNRSTGENLAWFLDGTPTDGSVVRLVTPLNSQTSSGWGLKGAGDFDRDGKTDLVFRFSGTPANSPFVAGDNEYWRMNGSTRLSRVAFPNVLPLAWDIRAVNDYDRDGYQDLLWRNGTTGANTIWLMRNNVVTNSVALPTVSDTAWQIFR
jgi:hypothetical protein